MIATSCLSKSFTRFIVVMVEHGRTWSQLTYDCSSKGQVQWDPAKVRDRMSEDGNERSVPSTLVDLYPERAIEYEWVSHEHKAVSRNILQGNDPADHDGSTNPIHPPFADDVLTSRLEKAFWRKIFRTAEAMT